jgi:SpoVK/Ycf46/Vps4 family AAA+-type ATPase
MESSLIIILIDEVESVAYARGSISSNEPSDSVRVVNSILTQLDKLKKFSNVLVIATSNLTNSIDLAFIDRADIITLVEQPSINAIFKILASIIVELADKNLIIADKEDDGRDEFNIDSIEDYEYDDLTKSQQFSTANIMQQCCKESLSLSSRNLRKLPFLTFAIFLKKDAVTLREYLIALRSSIDYVKKNKTNIGQYNM